MKKSGLALLIALLVVGCASTPLKQKVSAGHQTVRAALVALDDLERQLCEPAPAQVTHCTAPGAATVGLTDAKHQELSRSLAKALDADANVSAALIAWKAGDPMPKDVSTLLADANDTLAAIAPLTGSAALVTKARDVLTRVASLVALLAQ